jgi:Mrp family chromosome partitioning ATPase
VNEPRETSSVELPAASGGELGDFTHALRRQAWLLVLVAALVVLVGTVLVLRRPASWTSTASLLVPEESSGGAARSDSLVDLSTQRQVLRSETVAALARDRLAEEDVGLEDASPGDLVGRVAVEVPVDTRVLRLTASGDDAAQARGLARAFVSSYRDIAYLDAVADRDGLIELLQDDLEEADADLRDVNDELSAARRGSAAELEARSRRSLVTNRISDLGERRAELLATPIPVVRVLSPASEATTADEDVPVRDLALVLIAGLVLGAIAAVVRDRFDDRVRDGESVEVALGAPVLASVPAASRVTELVVADDPTGPGADAYRQLRVGVLGSPEVPSGTILLTGVRGGEGTGGVAANLAMALAATGRSVALVAVDDERPSAADHLEVDGPGLAEVLAHAVPPAEALQRPRWLPVSVLPRGGQGVAVGDMLQSEAMHLLHTALREEFDFVLLAAPPVLAAADAVALATLSDAAVVVTAPRRTSLRDVRAVRAKLARVGFPVLGAVLHGTPRASRRDGERPLDESTPEALLPAPPTDDGAEAPVQVGAPR